MCRLFLLFLFIGVTMSFAYAADCVPPGVDPQKCNADCQLPDCACEESEPDIPLNERPQVLFKFILFWYFWFYITVLTRILNQTTTKCFRLYTLPLMMLLLLLRRKNITEVYLTEHTPIQMDAQYVQLILFLLDLTTTHW